MDDTFLVYFPFVKGKYTMVTSSFLQLVGHVAEEGRTASTISGPVTVHVMNNTYADYSR